METTIKFVAYPSSYKLGYVVDWAHQVGCSHDHQLIANCLNFLDNNEAQVSLSALSTYILFLYLLFFIFIMKQTKESRRDGNHGLPANGASDSKDNAASADSSPAQNHEKDGEASLSMASNIHTLTEGKVEISAKTSSLPSLSKSQEVDHFVYLLKRLIQILILWMLTGMQNVFKKRGRTDTKPM